MTIQFEDQARSLPAAAELPATEALPATHVGAALITRRQWFGGIIALAAIAATTGAEARGRGRKLGHYKNRGRGRKMGRVRGRGNAWGRWW
jgi:hypothetical protein